MDGFYSSMEHKMPGACNGEAPGDAKTETFPFDLHGELEDAYDAADRNGDVGVVETLDAFGLWDERQRCGRSFLYRIWQALKGGAHAQTDVGRAFFWASFDPDELAEKYKWLDRPELAIYWYNLAAEAGHAGAQEALGTLYCPEMEPDSRFKLGRFARYWWEESAAQKHPCGMRGLAKCLRCGKCCDCDRDIPRAEALEDECAGADLCKRCHA